MSFEVYSSCSECFESSWLEGERRGVRGGPGEEKLSHVRHQSAKRKGGGGTLGCCLFVFEPHRKGREEKKYIPALAKHKLTPVSFIVFSCCLDTLLPMLYSPLLPSPPSLLSAVLG